MRDSGSHSVWHNNLENSKILKISSSQFYKTIITPSRGVGTYKDKFKYGVLTIHFNNKKLRDILCGEIENLRKL